MSTSTRTKAEQRFAEIQKRDTRVLCAIQTESQRRIEKSAKLREIRLAKEAKPAAIEGPERGRQKCF